MYEQPVILQHWRNGLWGTWSRRELKLIRFPEVPLETLGAWGLYVLGDYPWVPRGECIFLLRLERCARRDLKEILSWPDPGTWRLIGGTEREVIKAGNLDNMSVQAASPCSMVSVTSTPCIHRRPVQ